MPYRFVRSDCIFFLRKTLQRNYGMVADKLDLDVIKSARKSSIFKYTLLKRYCVDEKTLNFILVVTAIKRRHDISSSPLQGWIQTMRKL